MPLTVTFEFPFRVVVYPAPDLKGQWIAHCLETDIVTQGESAEHAVAMMADALETVGAYRVERGLFPVPRLRPAPPEVWALVGASKPTHYTARATLVQPGKRRSPQSTEAPAGFPLYAFVSQKPPAPGHAG
ncbi:MAG: hypothetical protein HY906_13995 [Deltaproteobacteria bacterium]|nr:hypothetical protein [Deltaproteobacteria bacterium]